MGYSFPPDVRRMIEKGMASGDYASEDDLLRDALESLAAESDDLAAIQEAIDELDAGDPGVPLHEAVDEIRNRHRTSTDA